MGARPAKASPVIHADSTWAVVVGIDVYNHVKPALAGAVHDAVAVVGWLRQLGVEDDRILLHASPSPTSKPDLDRLSLEYRGCTENEIWESFSTLGAQQGSRMFVFLHGHGFYEPGRDPGRHRLFLTKEARRNQMSNFGIDWLCEYLRGLRFTRQFVVMDGCLNLPYSQSLRSRIAPGAHSGVAPGPEAAGISQWLACGASARQPAIEINGRGLFTESLLATLDLQQPNSICARIDITTGSYQLDFVDAISNKVSQDVTQAAARKGYTQNPGVWLLSEGPTLEPIVATIPQDDVVDFHTHIEPDGGADDVALVVLQPNGLQWSHRVPSPPSTDVTAPFTTVFPAGLRGRAWCAMKSTAAWDEPPDQKFDVDVDPELVFPLVQRQLTLEPGQQALAIQTVDEHNSPVVAMTPEASDAAHEVLSRVGDAAIVMTMRDDGPLLWAPPGHEEALLSAGRQVAWTIGVNTPAAIHTTIVPYLLSQPLLPVQMGTVIEFNLDRQKAIQLGGFAAVEKNIDVAGQKFSLLDLTSNFQVPTGERGPVVVEAELPAGRWTTVVYPAPEGPQQPVTVDFPPTFGRAPIRNGLLRRNVALNHLQDDSAPASFALAASPRQPEFRAFYLPAEVFEQERIPGSNEQGNWPAMRPTRDVPQPWDAVFYYPDQSNRGRGNRLDQYDTVYGRIELPDASGFAVFPIHPRGVAVEVEPALRVEPLSTDRDPAWDTVVSLGQLDALDRTEIERLSGANNPLLNTVAAYACYANNFEEMLRSVLLTLVLAAPEVWVDGQILWHAVGMLFGDDSARIVGTPNRRRLDRLAQERMVPVFRWGISIGQRVAEHYGSDDFASWLGWIEERLAPTSTWTAWTPARVSLLLAVTE
jgi:hypothetical protein